LMIGGRYFGLKGALAALAGILTVPLVVVLILAAFYAGVADNPAVQGALRGMGAVAAGLITATGLKLVSALNNNPMGRGVCFALAALTFVAVALLHMPLAAVLLVIGGLACVWAYRQLGQVHRATGGTE
jgi:chromate transporter